MTTAPTTYPTTRVTMARIVQFILDTLMISLLLNLVGALGNWVDPAAAFTVDSGEDVFIAFLVTETGGTTLVTRLITGVVLFTWFVVIPARWNRTVGMAVMGLTIVRTDGRRASFLQHLARAGFLVLDAAGGGFLGWLVMVLSWRRQRIGDHVARTLVVRPSRG